jgi:hypothetical protein
MRRHRECPREQAIKRKGYNYWKIKRLQTVPRPEMERLHGGGKYREVKDKGIVQTILSELCLKINISVINRKDMLSATHLTEYGPNTKKEN